MLIELSVKKVVKPPELDILHLLENDIAKYSKLGSYLIMGDTNARTGINVNRCCPIHRLLRIEKARTCMLVYIWLITNMCHQ